MTEITLNGTAGPKTVVLIGIDADGNPTGPLPPDTTFQVLQSDAPDRCAVSANLTPDNKPCLVLDPSGPSVGDATITVYPQGLTGFALLVHVHAGNPVGSDVDPSTLA